MGVFRGRNERVKEEWVSIKRVERKETRNMKLRRNCKRRKNGGVGRREIACRFVKGKNGPFSEGKTKKKNYIYLSS